MRTITLAYLYSRLERLEQLAAVTQDPAVLADLEEQQIEVIEKLAAAGGNLAA